MNASFVDVAGRVVSLSFGTETTVDNVCSLLGRALSLPASCLRILSSESTFLDGFLPIAIIPQPPTSPFLYQVVLPRSTSDAALLSPPARIGECARIATTAVFPIEWCRQYVKYRFRVGTMPPHEVAMRAKHLVEMGFPEEDALHALRMNDFDIEQAAQYLTDQSLQRRTDQNLMQSINLSLFERMFQHMEGPLPRLGAFRFGDRDFLGPPRPRDPADLARARDPPRQPADFLRATEPADLAHARDPQREARAAQSAGNSPGRALNAAPGPPRQGNDVDAP
jgi:hypothetical protein